MVSVPLLLRDRNRRSSYTIFGAGIDAALCRKPAGSLAAMARIGRFRVTTASD